MSNVHKVKDRTNPAGYYWGFYERWCKACGICIAICPTDVYKLDENGKPELIDAAKCTNCGLCEILCPDFAIGWTIDPLDNYENGESERARGEIVSGNGEVTIKKIKRD